MAGLYWTILSGVLPGCLEYLRPYHQKQPGQNPPDVGDRTAGRIYDIHLQLQSVDAVSIDDDLQLFSSQKTRASRTKRFQGLTLNRPLFYIASYLYIIALYGFSAWFQSPVEVDDLTQPLWKTWFPDIHEN